MRLPKQGRLLEPRSPSAISKAEGRKVSHNCGSYMCYKCSGKMGRRIEDKANCECLCHNMVEHIYNFFELK